MNTIKINITKDPNYGFLNLEFSEKPTTEMLQELKNNGWRYSSYFKRWYPATEEAKKNAESFAQDYYRNYTSEEQTKTIKTAESLVDLNSIENAVDAYISEYESEMKKGNYNAFIEVQEFVKKNSFITPKAKSYINRFIHSIEDIKGVTAFVAYGNGFYSYDTGVSLISELNKKIENYESIKNNPGLNDYSDLLNMIKNELKMLDNSRNKGTLYSVLQKEGDSYEQKIRRSNERNNGNGRTDYSGESRNTLGNKVEEQRSVHNSDKISDPAGHSDSKMHDGLDAGRSTELEANGTSADIQRQRLQGNAIEQEKLSETGKINDSTRDAGNGTQNLSEGRVEVYSAERKGSIGADGNGLNKYVEGINEILRKFNIADNCNELSDEEAVALRELLSDKNRNREFKNESERRFAEACWKYYDAFRGQEKNIFIENINKIFLKQDPRKIYSYESFGYEGALVTVETDLRRGIPSVDIVGLSDSAVKESRERVRAAINNSGLDFPAERVLMSLSPADLKKESAAHDLAMALSVLNEKYGYKGEPVLALGELELSGKLRPVRSVHAAVESAVKEGIRNIIVPKQNVEEALAIPGVNVLGVSSLEEAHEKLINNEPFVTNETFVEPAKKTGIEFNEELLSEAMNTNLEGYYDTARAIEIAIAGKHNILLEGAPGCGKTLLTQHLIPGLTPNLTYEEAQTTTRIWSIAGLLKPTEGLKKDVPFRMPHQTASIEGICGGGTNVRPGEMSLAHNGVLFLDEAAEFRSSVLQMLRVPLESHSIALSRAGRTTVYPANFQLVMATNPCPCGNYGVEGKICLCSEKSREMYWKKFSDPLLDRIDIKQHVEKNEKDSRKISVEEMKAHIENAFRIQRKNPHYNASLAPEEIANLCSLNNECKEYFEKHTEEMSERSKARMLKLALTIANMDNRTEIALDDLKEARELNAPLFEKPNEFRKEPVYEAAEKKSKQIAKETEPYSFFVKDTAEFEQFAEFDPITNLSAEKAVETMLAQDMIELSAGIGIHIPGDSVFNDPDGMGAIVFNKFNGQYSFYMGENFVKELKDNNEHAKNVIAAFKELDEAIKHSRIKLEHYKEPEFVYEKEKELNGVENAKIAEYIVKHPLSSLDISKDVIEQLTEVAKQINNYVEHGTLPKNQRFSLPNSPAYLKALGADDTEISLPVSVVKKAIEKHNLSAGEINRAIMRLYDPMFAFEKADGENQKPSLLMVTDEFHYVNENDNNPLVLSLNINDEIKIKHHTVEVLDVRTIFDKTLTAKDETNLIDYWTKQGYCRYVDDKKITDWNTVSRNLFPIEVLQSVNSNILTKSALVNAQNTPKEQFSNEKLKSENKTYNINGEIYTEKNIEELLFEDIKAIFQDFDSGEIEQNLTLEAVKVYRNPEQDGKLSLLVQYDSKNPENKWREDSLFDALNEENITFNGMEVDVNPITADKSGTIEEYLQKLEGFEREDDVIKANAEKLEQLTSKKDIKAIREQCREILKKPDNEITNEDKLILAQYEGAGGLNEENRTISGILNEFYTPNNLVEKVWQIVDSYAPEAKTVLEPSAGVGKFANNRPNNTFTMHELDETSARINKILHPEANVIQGAYQKQFFDAGERIHIPQQKAKYDVVIGNPPYGTYKDKYKGLGEGKEFDRYEEYFISKGLDALKDENSVMAYVVPSGFLNTASDKQKEILASKGKLIDAYRLPVGVFPTTEVGTDIIIMQSWEKERKDLQKHWDSQGHFLTIDEAIKAEQKGHVDLLSNGEWFRQHPEKILGEIKTRTNRFGKEEEYVAVHEGLTVQDELNKIEDLLSGTNKNKITQQAETVSNEKGQQPITLSNEELSLAKNVIPEQQFITTLSLSKGEEGDFYKQKIKDIANAVSKAPKLYETDGAEQHTLLFRYFHPAGTESLVCEIGEDGEAFGFQCINGDYINAEWGYIDLNELKTIPEMQLDYHVPEGISIERWLYKEQPDMYPDYAKFAEQSEKTPFDIAKETGNNVEAVANAMNQQELKNISVTPVYRLSVLNRYDKHPEIENKIKKRIQNLDLPENFKLLFQTLPRNVRNFPEREEEPAYFSDFFSATADFSSGYALHTNGRGWDFIQKFSIKNGKVELSESELTPSEGIAKKLVDGNYEIEEAFIGYDFSDKNIYGSKGYYEIYVESFIASLNKALEKENEQAIAKPEAVNNAAKEIPSEKVHSETVDESVDDKSLREYDDPDGLFNNKKILSMQEFSKFYTGNNFDEKDYNIWANTDYKGIVNTVELSAAEKEYLETSGKYVEPEPGIWTNAMLYATGKIYEKLEKLETQKEFLSQESYERCKSLLEKAIPELYPMEKIQMDVLSPLAEEFTVNRTVTRMTYGYGYGSGKNVTSEEHLNLKEDFLSWCTGYLQPDSENSRSYIRNFSLANVTREEIPDNISFNDIAAYVDRIPVNTGISEDDTKEERNAKLTVAGAKKDARKETAYKLFNRYLQTGLSAEEKEQFCLFWNKIYNGTVQADYKKLPLFIDGMSTYKGDSPFKLYKQQIEGINRLVSKGNGLLAYGVGVGKTAAGIGATIAQMQSKRAKRPLIICPNQVYKKWVRDLRELFPNVTINELGNLSDPFLEANHYDEATHSLIIPENSVSVMTDSALQKITFTDEACNEYLAKDFGCVLGLSAEIESGDDRDRANALQKIQNLVGKASRIKTVKVPGDNIARETEVQQSYVFFDRCNFDNICVDEAHNYKNLFVIPRAKKGDKKQANEFEGIGSAAQSRRALKMFGMTTIIQQQNENRNVFLLTATPFTNNPLEVYSMLSFMARKELLDRHIYDVRDFCTEFALTKNEYAVTPDGDIKPKNVMKAFKGQKKLHSLITEFIDSKTAEEAGIPKPQGERHAVFLELTDLQQAVINYNEAAIKNASGKDGVVLRAMTHMRTATLSPALLDPDDYPGLEIPPLEQVVECSPKLKYVCDTVADVYKHKPECGQFIYMPQGVESFQYVKEYLIKQGVPEEAIEYVSGKHNNTNEKKQKVADRFNDKEDKLKILIGSSNVAEGIDLNGNSICCYNTMLGWNPTESVQVEGRIWRQGNEQGKVHIYYPLMEDSIDALIYQKHDEKVSRINSIFKENETDEDTIDVSEIDPETVKFELIKDPVKKVDMLIEQDTAEFKKELKILENRTETIEDLVKAYRIVKNVVSTQKDEHEKYSELVDQYREQLKKIDENDSSRWQYEGRLESAVHTRDVANKELQKGTARLNRIMTNFMRMDIKVPETEAAIKLEEIARKKEIVQKKIESIESSKEKRIEDEKIKLLQKKLVAKPIEEQRKETVEYILKNTWYKPTEKEVEVEKPVVKESAITTEPITSIPMELEEQFNEALEKKDFKVLSQLCCWGDRNSISIKEYSENNAAIKIFCDQFEKKYNIGLPSDIGDRFITLVNFCDPKTLPEQYKFKNWEEAISYELKDLNSGIENSSKRIKEFYEKKPNVNEFANFLKEEYGTGGHGFIGYNQEHDSKGIKLTVLINGKEETKLYSWNEIASRMSKIIEKSKPRVDFEVMSEEKRKSFDSFKQQDLFGFEELNPKKILEYGEYDEIGFTSKFINANKGLLPVIKEKEDVYKVYCKGKDIRNYESSKDIYIHDADDVEISVSKKLLQNVARQYIQNKVIENIKSEYEDGNFKKKKIAVPKLSEITDAQKDVFIKNGIGDENEMLKMYRETYKDVLLSGEKPILVANKQDSSVSVKDSRTVTEEATYIINDDNIGY